MSGAAVMAHLPALAVVVPLMTAPLTVLVNRPALVWRLATLSCLLTFAIAVGLLARVLELGPFVYEIGGWAAPWGIEYRIDAFNAYVVLVVTGVSAVAMPFARRSVEREVERDRAYLLYCAWMLALTGLVGIAVTGDLFNVFVFLEISSLATYVLVSMGRGRAAPLAALRYLVVGTVGATFFLIGVGLLYEMTGSLNMADLAARIPPIADSRVVHAGFVFIVLGLALKAALFPLHAWLPGAYGAAPSAVTAFLAGTATKVAIYALLRVVFTVFGARFAFGTMAFDVLLVPLALAGILVASAVAVFQQDLKRMLAYSSVAQIGYMLLGAGLVSEAGLTGGIVHMFNHALAKTALFLALGCIAYRVGTVTVASMAGLGRRMPWTMAAFVLGGLSLVGVPLTAGFVSKWYLVQAALERDLWWVAAIVLFASVLALIYTGRVAEAAYFRPAVPGGLPDRAREAPLSMLVPVWLLVGLNFYFGIDAALSAGVAGEAARGLLGGVS